MQSESPLQIDLAQASQQGSTLNISLNDSYFKGLDQEEIEGGQFDVKLTVKPAQNDIYSIKVEVEGVAKVLCDRCLDVLSLPVNAIETIKVKDGAVEDFDGEDLRYTEGRNTKFDFSWDIYEIIETSLPLQRVHPIGECNPEMIGQILTIAPDEEDFD